MLQAQYYMIILKKISISLSDVTFSTAKIDLYIKGKICWIKFSKSWEIFEGIKITSIKWSDSFNY